MKNLEMISRLLRRHLSLRFVNLAGLSIVLASLLVSVNYIHRELIWDRFNHNAESGSLELRTTVLTLAAFIAVTIAAAIVPAAQNMTLTRFLNTEHDSRPVQFSYGNVRWMLAVQYAVVITVLILAVGISRQLGTIAGVQTGGDGSGVMVMSGLTDTVMERYPLLSGRLEQSPLIKEVTTSFQLPSLA